MGLVAVVPSHVAPALALAPGFRPQIFKKLLLDYNDCILLLRLLALIGSRVMVEKKLKLTCDLRLHVARLRHLLKHELRVCLAVTFQQRKVQSEPMDNPQNS